MTRLATVRTDQGTRAARVDGRHVVLLGYPCVDVLLRAPGWRAITEEATGPSIALRDVILAPLVTSPSKIFGVGLNYRAHIAEMNRPLPDYPTLFAKFADCLIGPTDDLALPAVSTEVDWEAELAVIIGSPATRVSEAEAEAAIAGFSVANDVSMRDWQWRTTQWLQGKAFTSSTPVGPFLVTVDELHPVDDLELSCTVNGELMQHARVGDMVFSPAALVSYISQFTKLLPGDLILTGTPGGVGSAHSPKIFLKSGDVVEASITGIGCCRNRCYDGAGL